MGAHRLGYPNPEWMGLVDEQLVWMIELWRIQSVAGFCGGSSEMLQSRSGLAALGSAMDCGGLGDLTPRRGLVYDADGFVIYLHSAKEE
jgi:hypothetical protein